MEWRLKPTASSSRITLCKRSGVLFGAPLDRLTSLPDELLIQIFSLLPAKDVAAISVLSKRFRRVFPLITSLDFDFSHCFRRPYAAERIPAFAAFVDSVLSAHRSPTLTKFRLRMGASLHSIDLERNQRCLLGLNSPQVIKWISFPLTHFSLRELNLCIPLVEPGDAQLPPEIFTYKTLEVLKLDVNLGLDQISDMSFFYVPNLKLLRLSVSFIPEVSFLTTLVSGCPLLEDLTFRGLTHHVDHLAIYSHSLKRLCLELYKDDYGDYDNNNLVSFHTPNLEYLHYTDKLSHEYSVDPMNCLNEAELHICSSFRKTDVPVFFQKVLILISSVFCVKRLTLAQDSFMDLDCDALKFQLPVFPNLNHLILREYIASWVHWDNILTAMLNCSPILETLDLQMGVDNYFCSIGEGLESELEFFRKNEVIPSCLRYHLKKIEIAPYYGLERELTIIQFLLRHACVLEKLVIHRPSVDLSVVPKLIPDQISVKNTLKNLPRASTMCSILVL